MASILDIINTHYGELIVTKTSKTLLEEPEKVKLAYALLLPVAAIFIREKSTDSKQEVFKFLTRKNQKNDLVENLAEFDTKNLIEKGEEIIEFFTQEKHIMPISSLNNPVGLKEEDVVIIFKIASFVIADIMSAMIEKNNIGVNEVINLSNSLLGFEATYGRDLMEAVLKNKQEPGIINEDMSKLPGGKKGKEDKSILGGYTGGK